MNWDRATYRLTEAKSLGTRWLIFGGAMLAISAVGYTIDAARFFHAYLAAYSFWISLGLGALFFVMLHHLVGAQWSVVVRRLAEVVATVIPIMGLLFIPVLLGMSSLYEWSHADAVASNELLQHKAGFLNVTFFIVRSIIYFAIWIFLSRTLHQLSIQQDRGSSEALTAKMRQTSAYGMIIFALSVTLAGYDWLMSLDAHWYSTIFGVYFFAGGLLGFLALLTYLSLYLKGKKVLSEVITVEHYHDLGKLVFAFTIFWAYVGFSQYFLIWYANVPEETIWYLKRWEGSWKYVSLLIMFGQFFIPFLAMLFRATKRTPWLMKGIVIWILTVHYVDMYWLVYPTLLPEGASFSWMEATCLLGIGGLFLWAFWSRLAANPIVPTGDPKLTASIEHVNPF